MNVPLRATSNSISIDVALFVHFLIMVSALCQMLGCSPYESSLAPIVCMVGAIPFAQQ